MIRQGWRFYLDRWPASGMVRLPLGPLVSVDRITVYGASGMPAELAPAQYRVDTAGDPPRIALAPGTVLAPGVAIDRHRDRRDGRLRPVQGSTCRSRCAGRN